MSRRTPLAPASPHHAGYGRRQWLALVAAIVLCPAARAQTAPPVPPLPATLDGFWRQETPKRKGQEGLWIGQGKVRFQKADGTIDPFELSYRLDGTRLELRGTNDKTMSMTLRSDQRLVHLDPDFGLVVFARDPSATRPPPAALPVPALPRQDATPVATGTVPPVRGRYARDGQSVAELEFLDGTVRFLGQGAGAVLPFSQQGAQIIVAGPHMSESLWVLADGRLRMTREHMVPVHFRKIGY